MCVHESYATIDEGRRVLFTAALIDLGLIVDTRALKAHPDVLSTAQEEVRRGKTPQNAPKKVNRVCFCSGRR